MSEKFKFENSYASNYDPFLESDQICSIPWLTYHQMESMRMHRKFMIEALFARYMSIMSNMQYSVTEVTSKMRHVHKFPDRGLLGTKKFHRLKCTPAWLKNLRS